MLVPSALTAADDLHDPGRQHVVCILSSPQTAKANRLGPLIGLAIVLTGPPEELADLRQIEGVCISIQADFDQRRRKGGEQALVIERD